jgi:hypothetical protein
MTNNSHGGDMMIYDKVMTEEQRNKCITTNSIIFTASGLPKIVQADTGSHLRP